MVRTVSKRRNDSGSPSTVDTVIGPQRQRGHADHLRKDIAAKKALAEPVAKGFQHHSLFVCASRSPSGIGNGSIKSRAVSCIFTLSLNVTRMDFPEPSRPARYRPHTVVGQLALDRLFYRLVAKPCCPSIRQGPANFE